MTFRSRREFLRHGTAVAVSGAIIIREAFSADTKYVVAETRFGKLRGVDADGIKIFKGVPYAASTEGKNRFMPPVDPAKWTGVRDALEYGHAAPQSDPAAQNRRRGAPEAEDCLVLNIWTPAVNDG